MLAAAAARAAAPASAARGAALPPVVLLVASGPPDRGGVTVAAGVHPALAGLGRVGRSRPGRWRVELAEPADRSARRLVSAFTGPRPAAYRGGEASRRGPLVRVAADLALLDALAPGLGEGGPLAMGLPAARRLLAASARSGVLALAQDGQVPALLAGRDEALRLSSTPAAPGMVAVVDAGRASVVDLAGAMRRVAAVDRRQVWCSPHVDMLLDAAAGVEVTDPPGMVLHPGQRRLAGAYAALDRGGLVGALEPGTGKTLAAAVALGHQAARAAAADRRWSALVLVPAGLERRWCAELARAGLTCSVCLPDAGVLPVERVRVGVHGQAPSLAAAGPGLSWDDLVVDEADFLRGGSARAAAVRVLRGRATRMLALTATPSVRSVDDAVALVALAAGMGPAERGVPRPAAAVLPEARCGPLLVGSGTRPAGIPDLRWQVETAHLCAVGLADLAAAVGRWREADGVVGRRAAAATAARLPAAHAAVCPEPGCVREQLSSLVVGAVSSGGRVLLVVQAAAAVPELLGRLERAGVAAVDVSGRVPAAERARRAEGFEAGGAPVAVVSPASSVGVGLPGADLVVHAGVPVSVSELRQAAGRATRLGSPVPLVSSLVVAAGPVAAWARAALDGGPQHLLDHQSTG